MPAAYRVRQFFQAAGAWFQPRERDEVLASQYLTPEALQLFRAMPRYDQRHAIRVLGSLEEMGYSDSDLMAAALLHDTGKTVRRAGALGLWHRVAVVLIHVFWPGLQGYLAEDRPGSWRQAFYVQLHHAEISAEMAALAGCSARTVALIRGHEGCPDVTDDTVLLALRSADGMN